MRIDFLILLILGFVAYKIYIKRYNKKKRPYLIEDEALKLLKDASCSVMNEAMSQVYKRKRMLRSVQKLIV